MRTENGILSLDEIRFQLQDRLLYKVAAESRVSYPTLKRIRDTDQTNYRNYTIQQISKYLIQLTMS